MGHMPTQAPVEISEEKQNVGTAYLRCERCNLPIPVAVEIWIGTDEDGEGTLFTEANTFDLELHLTTHGPISIGGRCDDN